MIEIKNTKVRLYTVEELISIYNVTTLIPEIERISELSMDKEIILISHLAAIGQHARYVAAIPIEAMEGCYECVIINAEVIKEVITDGSKMRKHCTNCRLENTCSVRNSPVDDFSCWESIIDTGAKDEKPPLGLTPSKLYKEMANISRITDIFDAVDRYVQEGCKVPAEWIDELRERYTKEIS